MKNLNKSMIVRLTADCLIAITLLSVSLNFYKIFKYRTKRGFFCDDESLKYPYQPSTVSAKMLYGTNLYIPITAMALGEGLVYLLQRRKKTDAVQNQGFAKLVLKLHQNIIPFLCGFALQAIFVHTAKITLGRLRPYFFEVCQPYRQLDFSTCDNPKNHGLYIQDYECNANNLPNNVHQSFPSGHSSYIFYGMIFTILYLQRFAKTLRQWRIDVGIFMMVVQIFCALLAWFVAMSRVMDYRHHWSDVLVGIVLGTSAAIAVTLYVCQQLKAVNSWPEDIKSSLSSSSNSEATSTTTFAATMPNAILVP